jgi:hypothetical protein
VGLIALEMSWAQVKVNRMLETCIVGGNWIEEMASEERKKRRGRELTGNKGMVGLEYQEDTDARKEGLTKAVTAVLFEVSTR